MADLTYAGANLSLASGASLISMLTVINQLQYSMSTEVVTVSSTANGAVTSGNSSVNGYFAANTLMVTAGLAGGSIGNLQPLTILTNTTFANASTLTLTGPATFGNVTANNLTLNTITANVTVNGTITANTLSVANITSAVTLGGNVTHSNTATLTVVAPTTLGNTTANNLTATTLTANSLAVANITSNVTFSSNVTFASGATLTLSGVETAGNVTANNLTLTGIITSNTTVNGSITANSIATSFANVNGLVSIAGNTTLGSSATLTVVAPTTLGNVTSNNLTVSTNATFANIGSISIGGTVANTFLKVTAGNTFTWVLPRLLDLSDCNVGAATTGQVLGYTGSGWAPTSNITSFAANNLIANTVSANTIATLAINPGGGFVVNAFSNATASALTEQANNIKVTVQGGSLVLQSNTTSNVVTIYANGLGFFTGNANTAYALAANLTLATTGDATGNVSLNGSANASIALTLANTAVVAATYGNSSFYPTVTVDAKGRLISANTVANYALGLSSNITISTTGDATGSASTNAVSNVAIALTLANTTVASGAYGNSSYYSTVTIDSKGRVTSANTIANYALGLSSNITISTTGDAIGSSTTNAASNVAISLALSNTAVVPNTYGNSSYYSIFTVDSKGRITSANTIQNLGGVTSFNTRTGAVTLSSADVITALNYTPVTANGVNTLGSNLTIQNATLTLTNTTFTTATDVAARDLNPTRNLNLGSNAYVTGIVSVGNATVNTALTGSALLINGSYGTNGQTVVSNGSAVSWSSPAPSVAGSNTYIQFNDSGSLNAIAAFTFSKSTNTVYIGNATVNTSINATSHVISGNSTVYTTVNATSFSGTSNNTLYVGSTTAANVVSNSQLYSVIANYALLSGATFSGQVNVASNFNVTSGAITATGNITAYYSDKRLKINIKNIENPVWKLKQISGVEFDSNELAGSFGYPVGEHQIGVIAQEVEAVLPEAVTLAPFDRTVDLWGHTVSKSGENYKTVYYEKIVPLLIEAVKELSARVEYLESRV